MTYWQSKLLVNIEINITRYVQIHHRLFKEPLLLNLSISRLNSGIFGLSEWNLKRKTSYFRPLKIIANDTKPKSNPNQFPRNWTSKSYKQLFRGRLRHTCIKVTLAHSQGSPVKIVFVLYCQNDIRLNSSNQFIILFSSNFEVTVSSRSLIMNEKRIHFQKKL